MDGNLFQHTRPANISGMHTITTHNGQDPAWTGWDGKLLPAHFLALDLNWCVLQYSSCALCAITRMWVGSAVGAAVGHAAQPSSTLHGNLPACCCLLHAVCTALCGGPHSL